MTLWRFEPLNSRDVFDEGPSSLGRIFGLKGLPELHSSRFISLEKDLSLDLGLWSALLLLWLKLVCRCSGIPLLLVIVSLMETLPPSVMMFSEVLSDFCYSRVIELSLNLVCGTY